MTQTQQLFLQAAKAALRGKRVDWPEMEQEQWQELMELAHAQHMTPMLVEAVYTSAAFRMLPEEIKWQARKQARQQVFAQIGKDRVLYELLGAMEKAKVPVLVMKGAVCRSLYPLPEARPSSDEDLLVPPEAFERAVEVLRKKDFRTEQEDIPDDAYEVGFFSSEGMHIELHRLPLDPDLPLMGAVNDCFSGAFENKEIIKFRGTGLPAMPPHEHMLFLLLHAFKHLLHTGVGLRQMCDILLWGERYADGIDWRKLEEQCTDLHAWDFARGIFAIGREHLGVELPVEPGDMSEQMTVLLEDVFSGGVFGGESLSRKHSANITLNAVEAEQEGKKPSVLSAIFPGRKSMEGRYPWLSKRPALLPLAWGKRLADYAAQPKDENNDPVQSLRIGRERVELLRKLNVIA